MSESFARAANIWDGQVVPLLISESETPACRDVEEVPEGIPFGKMTSKVLSFQKEYCSRCPIFVECASHAMKHEPYGTWGLSEGQRADLGGVVPPEWAEWVRDPSRALTQAEASGIDFLALLEWVRDHADALGL